MEYMEAWNPSQEFRFARKFKFQKPIFQVVLSVLMAVSEEESTSANSKSRSASNGTYYLAKCVLKGSVVLQVVHGHIRSPSSNDIVFGKVSLSNLSQ